MIENLKYHTEIIQTIKSLNNNLKIISKQIIENQNIISKIIANKECHTKSLKNRESLKIIKKECYNKSSKINKIEIIEIYHTKSSKIY